MVVSQVSISKTPRPPKGMYWKRGGGGVGRGRGGFGRTPPLLLWFPRLNGTKMEKILLRR